MSPVSRRQRPSATAKVERRKRIITYVTVEREIVTLGPVSAAVAIVMRKLRNDNNMTQADASSAMGISRPALANIEAGRQRVLLEDVWMFSKTYGVPEVKLFSMIAKHVTQER